MAKAPLSSEELTSLVALLNQLEPGVLPLPVFIQVARLVVTPIVEIVPLRQDDAGNIEVLLMERSADDPVWAGQLHTPGTVVRSSDQAGSLDDAMARVLQGELGLSAAATPVFVGSVLHRQARGMELAQIYFVEHHDTPQRGRFVRADHLPGNLIATQVPFIEQAVEAYRQQLKA